jgi:3',5'-cyclic AMP phosphodiesterase CpdA
MMKKIPTGLAVLVLVSGVWAASKPQGSATRIAFVADTHVNLQTNKTGVAYRQHLHQAIAAINAAKVDFVLIAGDLTDSGTREQMTLFREEMKAFEAPVLFVPGNHDVGILGFGDVKTSITSDKVRRFGQEVGPNWFAREQAGVRIVGINSCLFGTGFSEEEEQWKFLEKELAKPQAKPTLLVEHYPPFIRTADEPRQSTWNVEPALRKRLLALAERGGVRAVLSGHLHYPITNRVDSILFLGNTAIAYGIPQGKQPEGWMLLSVPTEGSVQFEFRTLQ